MEKLVPLCKRIGSNENLVMDTQNGRITSLQRNIHRSSRKTMKNFNLHVGDKL